MLLRYNSIKTIPVNPSGPISAGSWLQDFPNRGYDVTNNNCLTAVDQVLRAYGVRNLPNPTTPNAYYNKISGKISSLYDVPPSTPYVPSGLDSGTAGKSYIYSTKTIDPNNYRMKYIFDWGDDTPQTTTALVRSNTAASASHSWSAAGTYLVKAMAINTAGAASAWSNTFAVSITPIPPPNTPSIPSGSTSGTAGKSYIFSTKATDPSGNRVKYTFDWGDGKPQKTTGLVASGKSASASHIWSAAGTYLVKAMATNSKGETSEWSNILTVTITAQCKYVSKSELASLVKSNFPSGTTNGGEDIWVVAYAVACAESSKYTCAENLNLPKEDSIGLWQINLVAHPGRDPTIGCYK